MIRGHVGHDRDIDPIEAEALAQDPAPRDLEHARIDRWVLQDHPRRSRPGHVTTPDHPPVDHNAVGRGHADAPAHQLQDVGDHPDGRRLAVRTGHREDRDAGRGAGREQQVDDALRDVLGLALGRVGVHAEPWRRVDLDDRAAGLAHRHRDVRADEVDAGNVEPDDARRHLRNLDVVRVRLDRPVDRGPAGRHVAGQRELDSLALGWDLVQLEALRFDERVCRVVHPDPGQDLLVADAATGICVRLVDQLADGLLAVTDDGRRHALRDRRHLAADHQAPIVVAGHEGFDHEVAAAALAPGALEGRSYLLFRTQVQVDTTTVVAVERFDDAGQPDALRCRDCGVRREHDLALGHRQAGRVEEAVGQVLVAGDVDRDARRPAGHRGADALLVDTVPELDERVLVQAQVGDVSGRRFVEDCLGRRTERLALGEENQALQLLEVVERLRGIVGIDEVVDDPDRQLAGGNPDGLLAVLEDDVVLALGTCRTGLAVVDRRAGEVLELQRDVLGDVPDPRAVLESRDETAAAVQRAGVVLEGGHPRDQAIDEPRNLGRRELFEHSEIDQHLHDRLARPVVGASEDACVEDLQRRQGSRLGGTVAARARLRAGCARGLRSGVRGNLLRPSLWGGRGSARRSDLRQCALPCPMDPSALDRASA